MKNFITILILAFNSFLMNAQDYKNTFNQLLTYSDTGFKDILGSKIDESPDGKTAYYQSKFDLKLGFAEIGINKSGIGSFFTWQIPLEKSNQIITEMEKFIQENYNNEDYYIATEGNKKNGNETISVSDGFGEIFINIVYNKDQKSPSNSGYFIQIIGI